MLERPILEEAVEVLEGLRVPAVDALAEGRDVAQDGLVLARVDREPRIAPAAHIVFLGREVQPRELGKLHDEGRRVRAGLGAPRGLVDPADERE